MQAVSSIGIMYSFCFYSLFNRVAADLRNKHTHLSQDPAVWSPKPLLLSLQPRCWHFNWAPGCDILWLHSWMRVEWSSSLLGYATGSRKLQGGQRTSAWIAQAIYAGSESGYLLHKQYLFICSPLHSISQLQKAEGGDLMSHSTTGSRA